MNYSDIRSIIDRHGLSNEPAFDDVFVEIAPIHPDQNGQTPLGLYFPDDKLIVLPPTLPTGPGSLGEDVTLHEFGHRHGHFYFDDISEPYAENYRRHEEGVQYHYIGSGVT